MFEKNIINIEKYNPELAKTLRNHKILGNYTFEAAKSGDIVLLYENLPVHSLENPQQEALSTYNNLTDTSKQAITIVFGLGLGYLFKRVFLSSQGRIILYEPNIDILKITLESVDFSEELKNERVLLLTDKKDLEKAFKKYYLFEDPINMCFSSFYKQLFPDLIKDISEEVSMLKGVYNNNYYSLFEISTEWLDMSLKNFNYFMNSHYIGCLKGKFKNIPAIITSAGPSLSKNIDQLATVKDKALIFSVGASLRVVKKQHNIHPDFAVFIDVTDKAALQVKDIPDIDQMNFILQPYANHNFYMNETKRKFTYLAANDNFCNWLSKHMKLDITDYYNKGTVAMSALYAAMNFGCNPIILMGQDLAFTNDGKIYADESITTEGITSDLKVKGWNGEMLPTNSSYMVFKRYYESLAEEWKGKVRIINATEGGAYINGFEHMSFKEASSLITESKPDVDKTIEDSINNYQDPFKKHKLKLQKELKSAHSSISKLTANVKTSKFLLDKLKTELNKADKNTGYIEKTFQQLYQNNGRLDLIINNECPLIAPMVQKELMAFQQNFGPNKSIQTLEEIETYLTLSENYFKAILERTPRLNEILEQVVKAKKK
ncbi:MAG: motility associated factor glycosyltransferase family protein [Vampirovibrionia bacterium]